MSCPRCGTKFSAKISVCPQCGQTFARQQSAADLLVALAGGQPVESAPFPNSPLLDSNPLSPTEAIPELASGEVASDRKTGEEARAFYVTGAAAQFERRPATQVSSTHASELLNSDTARLSANTTGDQEIGEPVASQKVAPSPGQILALGVIAVLLLGLGFTAGIFSTGYLVNREGNLDGKLLLYRDDLAMNRYNWREDGNHFFFSNGAYVLQSDRTQSAVSIAPGPLVSDFALTIEISQQAGGLDHDYGVAFRFQPGGTFYLCGITSDGRFAFAKAIHYRIYPVIKTQTAATIRIGLKAINTLKIVAIGNRYLFYVNGIQVSAVVDQTIVSSGAVFLYASGGNIAVAFRHLRVYTIPD